MKFYFILLFFALIFIVGCSDNPVRIDKEDFDPDKQIECEDEERSKECAEIYQPVCGWSNENVRCLVYPCANNYGNACEACANRDIGGYTLGKCPLNEDLYNNKKEEKFIEMAKEFVLAMGQYKENNGKDLKIVGIGQAECSGCNFVESEFYLDSEDEKRINRGRVTVVIRNFEIIDTRYAQEAVNYG